MFKKLFLFECTRNRPAGKPTKGPYDRECAVFGVVASCAGRDRPSTGDSLRAISLLEQKLGPGWGVETELDDPMGYVGPLEEGSVYKLVPVKDDGEMA